MPTVTLLFVDQVGSTAQLDALGDVSAGRVRRALLDQLRLAVRDCGGREVEFTGDGLFAAFDSATSGVDAALLMQRSVRTTNASRPVAEQVGLRVGLHTGEPTADDDGRLFGLSVVVARRLCDRAGAGETLVSDVVRALVEPGRPWPFRDAGEVELKGVRGRHQIWAIEVARSEPPPDPAGRRDEPTAHHEHVVPATETTPALHEEQATTRLGPPIGRLDLPGGGSVPLGLEPCVIGRGTGATILIDDSNASRRHAEIRLVGAHLVVRDLGSTNGTRVNGVPVLERVLLDGDEIGVGLQVFRIALVEQGRPT